MKKFTRVFICEKCKAKMWVSFLSAPEDFKWRLKNALETGQKMMADHKASGCRYRPIIKKENDTETGER
jgi:hypothetical protein